MSLGYNVVAPLVFRSVKSFTLEALYAVVNQKSRLQRRVSNYNHTTPLV